MAKINFTEQIEKMKLANMEIDTVELINMTGKDITVLDEGKQPVTIPASDVTATIMRTENLVGRIQSTNIQDSHTFKVYGSVFADNVYNMPNYDKDSNKVYIVDQLVATTISALGTRPTNDLLVVDNEVKNKLGDVIGVRGFRVVD